jgi:hypothetical protein
MLAIREENPAFETRFSLRSASEPEERFEGVKETEPSAAAKEGRGVQTKGHRVIAIPLCPADLAPPAFTAPCRNQINEPASRKGKWHAYPIYSENGVNTVLPDGHQ